jgi:hypothetical protein
MSGETLESDRREHRAESLEAQRSRYRQMYYGNQKVSCHYQRFASSIQPQPQFLFVVTGRFQHRVSELPDEERRQSQAHRQREIPEDEEIAVNEYA